MLISTAIISFGILISNISSTPCSDSFFTTQRGGSEISANTYITGTGSTINNSEENNSDTEYTKSGIELTCPDALIELRDSDKVVYRYNRKGEREFILVTAAQHNKASSRFGNDCKPLKAVAKLGDNYSKVPLFGSRGSDKPANAYITGEGGTTTNEADDK